MYAIELTYSNQRPYIWKEGGLFTTKAKAEFQAKQLRKMRRYNKIETIKLPVT